MFLLEIDLQDGPRPLPTLSPSVQQVGVTQFCAQFYFNLQN